MTDTAPAERKSFTSRKPPLAFDIDGEEMFAHGVLAAEPFADFAEQVSKIQRSASNYEGPDKLTLTAHESVHAILGAIEIALVPESAAKVAERIRDSANPIDLDTLAAMLMWLLGKYGMTKPEGEEGEGSDPTPEPSGSPAGSATTAPSSSAS